jgi:hypothetical protein
VERVVLNALALDTDRLLTLMMNTADIESGTAPPAVFSNIGPSRTGIFQEKTIHLTRYSCASIAPFSADSPVGRPAFRSAMRREMLRNL